MSTDTSEKGLESLIMRYLTGTDGLAAPVSTQARPETPYGGIGYLASSEMSTIAPTRWMRISCLNSCVPPSPHLSPSWQ